MEAELAAMNPLQVINVAKNVVLALLVVGVIVGAVYVWRSFRNFGRRNG